MRRLNYRTRRALFTTKLVAIISLCLCLVVAVGGTLAWIIATTDPVVNTFTYGDIDITLSETTEEYKMIPGNSIDKDPTVTVKSDSEDCWLFVKVEESENLDDFVEYAVADGWTALTGVDGVYYREVSASDEDQSFGVLKGDAVTVKGTVTKTMLAELGDNGPTLTFTAYAVQKANVTDAATAWGYVTAA